MFNTLLELYQHSIHAYSSNKCFSMYGGEALTYRDFADRVDSLIETFVASGLSHGDKIALLSNNMPNWGAAYFAAAFSVFHWSITVAFTSSQLIVPCAYSNSALPKLSLKVWLGKVVNIHGMLVFPLSM